VPCREQQGVCARAYLLGEVRVDPWQQMRWDGDGPRAGRGLGIADEHLAVDAGPPRSMRLGCLEVDVGPTKLRELAEAQTAPRSQQNHQPVPLRHRRDDRLELRQGCHRWRVERSPVTAWARCLPAHATLHHGHDGVDRDPAARAEVNGLEIAVLQQQVDLAAADAEHLGGERGGR
jgi:hypothetical protein